MFDEFFPNVYSQLHAHSFLIHNIVDAVVLFLRKYHKTHCHLRLKFPTFTHDRNDLKLMEFHKRHIHLKKRKKALNFERGGSSKLSKADEVIPGPPFMASSCHMIRTADQWNQTHMFPLGAGRQSCGDTAYSGISFSHNVSYYHQNKVTGYQSV